MKNPNALITMAIVSENAKDPYYIFCEYIKYCIYSNANEIMTIKEVKESFSNCFGINIPTNVLLFCLQKIASEHLIEIYDHKIKRQGSYDVLGYESRRQTFREIEEKLVSLLIEYVGQFDLQWTHDNARQQLIKILSWGGVAFDVFFQDSEPVDDHCCEDDIILTEGKSEEVPEKPVFTEENLTGRFISDILESDSLAKDYLTKICEGIMICTGAFQIQNAQNPSASISINGTSFFFDTRLLLRYLGCANSAAVEGTKELVNMIKEKRGRIYYYPYTLEEMNSAFDAAIGDIAHGYPPRDSEMRMYCSSMENKLTTLAAKKASLQVELAKDDIHMTPLSDFSHDDRIKFGFEYNELEQYMKGNLGWEIQTIEYDATSIWETHMRRRGAYQAYYGTTNALGVFVTSNARLISIALDFRRKHPHIKSIQSWKNNKLPVITDIRLACRLWSPEIDCQHMSLLRLSANAVAAQQPTPTYINRIRDLANELKRTVPQYSEINLDEFFDDSFTDNVVIATKANEGNLNIGVFANTLDEFLEMKTRKHEEETEKFSKEAEEWKNQFGEQTNAIINDAVQRNIDKLGGMRILLWMGVNWIKIISVFFVAISAVVSIVLGSVWPLLGIIVPVIIKILELLCSSLKLKEKLNDAIYQKVVQKFNDRICSSLGQAEKQYEAEILKRCIDENERLSKVRSYIQTGGEEKTNLSSEMS